MRFTSVRSSVSVPLVVIAAISSALAGVLVPKPAAAALSRADTIQIISRTPVAVTVERNISICADETSTTNVTLAEHITYRWGDDAPGRVREIDRPLARSLKVLAAVKNGNTVTVTPSSAWLRPPRDTISFELHGVDPGANFVELTTEGRSLAILSVVVEECEFRLSMNSHWQLGMGWQPDLFSYVSGLALKRVRKDVYTATGMLVNEAAGIAVGDCIPRFKVDPSRVIAKLEIGPGKVGQEALLNVGFGQVAAATQLNCAGYPAGTTNSATIADIIDFPVPLWDASAKQHPNHRLETQGYQATGFTSIFVSVVRP